MALAAIFTERDVEEERDHAVGRDRMPDCPAGDGDVGRLDVIPITNEKWTKPQ
jgi:hypothetical protein